MGILNFKKAKVYVLAFEQAMTIFKLSKNFPKEEKYSLTDQVRRSARSVNANMAEGFRRKKYPAHFVLKITDCDAENSETGVWLDFSLACEYITEEIHKALMEKNEEIGRLLHHMIDNPGKYQAKGKGKG